MGAAPSATFQYLDRYLAGEVPIRQFEQWVYASLELENAVGPSGYFDLLEFDFHQAHADLALAKLLQRLYEEARPGLLLSDRAFRYARALIDESMPAYQAVHGLANLWYAGHERVWVDIVGISSDLDDTPKVEDEAQWHPEVRRACQAEWAERRQRLAEAARAVAREFLRNEYPDWDVG